MRHLVCLALTVALALPAAVLPAVTVAATPVPLTQLLHDDMTLPHDHAPNGVPTNYRWKYNPFQSPAAPPDYHAITAWGQWYRCEGAPIDPDDVLELKNVQAWELSNTGVWTGPLQTGVLSGSAYPEDFVGSAQAANIVAQSTTSSWMKVRMSREGYNFHVYPQRRAGYDPATTTAVVVLAEARLLAYGSSTQCTVFGMGADYWQGVSSGSVKGATLGRLKHVEGWRVFTATAGDMAAVQANPPPVDLPASEIR